MIPRLGDGNKKLWSIEKRKPLSLENDSPSRGRKQHPEVDINSLKSLNV